MGLLLFPDFGRSVDGLVVTSAAAGFAIQQAVGAKAYVQLRLAENTEFLAPTGFLGLLALGTDDSA
jgi:hypothetical protein